MYVIIELEKSTEDGRNMSRKRMTTYQRRRKAQKRMQLYRRLGMLLLCLLILVLGGMKLFRVGLFSDKYTERTGREIDEARPDMDVQLLTENEYSRPATKTDKITGIVIHYTANPGTTAMQNRDYFEGLKDSHLTKASSHFVVGMEGEIVQCVPTWEVAYASNDRNHDTVSIETCHPKEDGKYTKETYESLVELTAWLCKKFGLDEKDVIRHYDVTGKICPKYFVENEAAWKKFRKDVKRALG